jgi:hypothetical protein
VRGRQCAPPTITHEMEIGFNPDINFNSWSSGKSSNLQSVKQIINVLSPGAFICTRETDNWPPQIWRGSEDKLPGEPSLADGPGGQIEFRASIRSEITGIGFMLVSLQPASNSAGLFSECI